MTSQPPGEPIRGLPHSAPDRRQAIEGIVIDPAAIEGKLPDPGQPAGEAALRLTGGLAAEGVETPESDQAAGVPLHHLHDVVVVQFKELWVLPGKAEDNRLVDAVSVHGRQELGPLTSRDVGKW